ncbi:MAG: PilT protein domain-containing protein [Candidatus Magnetoglobus multicellularis str. Araruama]|uniref:PilT protein domain-containing protein n=1 Tax=Candidatus Magnetoglobus multicellularis str. Araruama TaxID=890399 RepID=A0A1V1P3L8_9BACT|nr:MAG: PilT protein domain-containing protein [Candidatus Magnetoglobus multicellularis str. Araruama]
MIDTSIIIDHLRKKNKEKSILFKIVDLYNFHLSTIVEFELFAGVTNEKKIKDINEILGICIIHPLSSEIVKEAAKIYQNLRQMNQLIEIRDIFIAATSIVNRLPLITLNMRHFERIDSLELISN